MSSDPVEQYDVFLSHSSADKPAVEALAEALRGHDIRPFLDAWHLVPGEPWQEALEAALETSSTCAVILGPGGIGRWQHEEMRLALEERVRRKKLRVIAVLLPGAGDADRDELPAFLRRLTWVDFRADAGDGLRRLVAGIRGVAPGAPAQPPARVWTVPHRRNPYFTGRGQDLEAIERALRRGGKAVVGQTHAISGLGGIGKTQTAIEYCYRRRDDYATVLWVRGETKAELVAGFGDVAAALGLPGEDADAQIAAVQHWLEANASWLLVVDNADDPELLAPLLPAAPKGHVLLTSRARYFGRLGIPSPLRLETLPPDDARKFLLARIGRAPADGEERSAAGELARRLGYLPLALEQAGAYIAARDARVETYLASYRRHRGQLLGRAEPETGDYPASVATTWALNFEEVETVSKASGDVLRASAFLSPDLIPEELLTLGASELGPAIAEALAGADDDPLALDELLEPLTRYSLIERNPDDRSYGLHRLVQEVVRGQLDDVARRRWEERVVRALARAFPKVEFQNWGWCERLLPHALAAFAGFRAEIETVEAARTFGEAASYLHDQGRYAEAEPLYQRALAIREKALEPDDPNLAVTLNNLANLYREQGRYADAEPVYKRALAIYEKALGSEHRHLATSLNNLANLYRAQGRYAEAEPLYQRDITITEKALGSEHPHLATSLNNLANLYREQGRYADAERLYKRAQVINEKALGLDHPDLAANLHNLGNLYRDQDRNAEAEPLYRRSLAIKEKALEPGHPRLANTLESFAILLRKTGRAEEAEEMEARAERIRAKHRSTSASRE